MPIFAGLSSLFPGGNLDSHIILSVLPRHMHGRVEELVRDVAGGFDEPGSGIMFAVPVTGVNGLGEGLC
ncbi:MAG: hypothetical protein D6806_09750 [Deltaproteobacteria bacterium]|nr:MAG: hypothetical protein D6806_09750 [Deltaproteobacteria bacterium]